MQKQLSGLLQKDMTRKEFFMALGYGAVAMAGMGAIVQFFGKELPNPLKQQASSLQNGSNGYGASAYGR